MTVFIKIVVYPGTSQKCPQMVAAGSLCTQTWLCSLFCSRVFTPEAECSHHCTWTGKTLNRICSVPECAYKIYNSIACSLEWNRFHTRLFTYLFHMSKFWLTVFHSCLLFSCFSSSHFLYSFLSSSILGQPCFIVTLLVMCTWLMVYCILPSLQILCYSLIFKVKKCND